MYSKKLPFRLVSAIVMLVLNAVIIAAPIPTGAEEAVPPTVFSKDTTVEHDLICEGGMRIEEGVEVKVAAGVTISFPTRRAVIVNDGRLILNGTSERKCRIINCSGITYKSKQSTLNIRNSIVELTDKGVVHGENKQSEYKDIYINPVPYVIVQKEIEITDSMIIYNYSSKRNYGYPRSIINTWDMKIKNCSIHLSKFVPNDNEFAWDIDVWYHDMYGGFITGKGVIEHVEFVNLQTQFFGEGVLCIRECRFSQCDISSEEPIILMKRYVQFDKCVFDGGVINSMGANYTRCIFNETNIEIAAFDCQNTNMYECLFVKAKIVVEKEQLNVKGQIPPVILNCIFVECNVEMELYSYMLFPLVFVREYQQDKAAKLSHNNVICHVGEEIWMYYMFIESNDDKIKRRLIIIVEHRIAHLKLIISENNIANDVLSEIDKRYYRNGISKKRSLEYKWVVVSKEK